MKYMGSKRRLSKELLQIILKDRSENQFYIEPFVGGANMIENVSGMRIGVDINEYLIELLEKLSQGWIPPEELSEEEYKDIMNKKESYTKHLVGFVGICCSFGGKWFGGYCRGNKTNGEPRNYTAEAKRNVLKQSKKLAGINFVCNEYDKVTYPKESIIYCDPPYESTTKYKDNFNHKKFWQWCRDMTLKGHNVFVSEYNAPEDFECIWEKEVTNSINTKKTHRPIEKLFICSQIAEEAKR